MTSVLKVLVISSLFLFLLLLTACASAPERTFSGEQAYAHVLQQCALGPRPTGSPAHRALGDAIIAHLEHWGWVVETQEFTYRDTPIRNIIGKAGEGPVVIVGAHYDTRRAADREDPSQPVLGANDGASGTAVLMELARVLEHDRLRYQVWLTFFDAEDNGGLDEWEWCVGSSYMAANLTVRPEAVIVVDMVGDADQQFYLEHNSDPTLQRQLWDLAATLGYTATFIPEYRWAIYDDHVPFARRGIPAVDIIDFDYPYWHTTRDTPDKVSPESLERVGRLLEAWLERE
ncbi:MAG: M28 family peptidase [Anaerolineae bacterium]|nr:M28 family peptidase [Anaerolineae bacterium]MDW7992335.1 M28 family peptidase [Anaerolineae bacterium]